MTGGADGVYAWSSRVCASGAHAGILKVINGIVQPGYVGVNMIKRRERFFGSVKQFDGGYSLTS